MDGWVGVFQEGVKAKFAVSTWLAALQLRIPCLFLCLTTVVFPASQEVSSVSCHSPLSCGHFLVFCLRRSVLLTQRTEVVLLAAGSGRTERRLFIISGWTDEPSEIQKHQLAACFHNSWRDYIPLCKNTHELCINARSILF